MLSHNNERNKRTKIADMTNAAVCDVSSISVKYMIGMRMFHTVNTARHALRRPMRSAIFEPRRAPMMPQP